MRPTGFSSIVEALDNTLHEGMTSMNYLVFLNVQAGELEKILSGTKSMLLRQFDPDHHAGQAVNAGDSLYFLRNKGDCDLRVKATVSRVVSHTNQLDGDLSHLLKEMQPKLQLTEDQYNEWSIKAQVLFVEFGSALKIDVIQVALDKITERSGWVAFEEFSQII